MKSTISVAPDVVRARVQALTAMHIFMEDLDRRPLTADNNAALNQAIVFAFSRALVKVAKWVDSFSIDPMNFYDNPDDLLLLEVTFKTDNGMDVNWPLVRRALEEFISVEVMRETLPDCRLVETYSIRSNEALGEFADTLTQSTDAFTKARIKRTI